MASIAKSLAHCCFIIEKLFKTISLVIANRKYIF